MIFPRTAVVRQVKKGPGDEVGAKPSHTGSIAEMVHRVEHYYEYSFRIFAVAKVRID
ncbi:MAG: hypothetical protein K2Y23_01075 [Cyanobacteria bacterium]|nr:hypothetical protein [Cyanobacteriota bacterium]